jgi:hypothetical protein
MKYTYTEYVRGKPITFIGNYDEMKAYLVNYCKTHKRNNAFNISRDFTINDNNGIAYEATCKFDRNCNLKYYNVQEIGVFETPVFDSTKPKYELQRKIREQDAVDFFRTRDEMLRYIKACPNNQFILTIYDTKQKFTVKFIPKQGLQVDGKIYKNF